MPDQPVDVLSEDDLRALLGTCSGRSFEDVRDAAIIRLFVDTGMRRAELLGLRVEDLDLDQTWRSCREGQPIGPGRSGTRPAKRRPIPPSPWTPQERSCPESLARPAWDIQ